MAVTTASMVFLKRDSWPSNEKPYVLLYPPSDDLSQSNYTDEPVDDIPIHDMRPLIDELSLDREGFMVGKLDSRLSYTDFANETKLRSVYADEVRRYLLNLLGARPAYIHECVIRQRGDRTPRENNGHGQPVSYVHTDYTKHVWKPLRGPLKDWPLAICDLQSLRQSDLHPLDEVHRHDVLESHLVTYRPGQKWYYLSEQDPSEVLIFKSVDSCVKGEGESNMARSNYRIRGSTTDDDCKCHMARFQIRDT
ncbi:hypothetical protein EV356DRAFT_514155 [Viridothelium virens]|uniref:CmcJ-like methyltransferase n=1 Tax=Viridothelium virens TaxID=1048519 RepID=A0A6A6HCB1_VIRVR|nr:hypothetical protein EV356DRAFT_514155 [Viridothelium virens]